MNEVIYKIRVNRPCRLFIDDEEMMILDENKLTKITLPEGEYLRKVVAIDNKAIYDEAEITLSGASKLDNITLDTTGLEEAKRNALPKEQFQVGDLMYKALEDGSSVAVAKYVDKNITEVVIPEEIKYADYTYSVTEIIDRAFQELSNLASVNIPSSIVKIGEVVFCACPNLEKICVDKGNKVYDSRNNCNAIIETSTNILIRGCKTTKIPNNITSIYRHAFCGSEHLDTIHIPNSVSSIGEKAFNRCKLLTSITIPNSVTSIGNEAFCYCSGLTSITIPNSVTSIEEGAFGYCSGLMSITIPNSVTSIEEGAFGYCSGLTSITIPNSVTSIGDFAFSSCSGLTSITIPNSVTSIGEWAFDGCKSLTSITIPNSVSSIGDWAFSDCSSLTSVTIPNGVTSIGDIAFSGCTGLTSITIPNSVTSIGKYAFAGCKSLTSFTIPNSVTSIGDWAFIKCFRLTSVTVPSHTEIADNAFPEHTQIIRE